jgi:hypothetical protein
MSYKNFIKLFAILVYIFLNSSSAFTQNLGNEWIDYSKTYYKVKVWRDGIHRINKSNLDNSGIDLSNTNSIQLFKNGIEQEIYIKTNGNEVEYIEFFGEKNDGSFDVSLYNTPSEQLNPYYSLYSDTSVYFLTNGSSLGLRYNDVNSNLTNLPVKESIFIKEDIISFNQAWNGGVKYSFAGQDFYKSFYETGEGWGFGENSQFNYTHTLNTSITNQTIEVEMNVSYVGSVLHTPIVRINGVEQFNEMYNGQTTRTIRFTTQINSNNLNITLGGNGEKYNIGYIKIKYQKDYDFNENSSYIFNVESNNQRKFLEITNFKNTNNTQDIYLYDLTSKKRIHCFWGNSKVLIDLSPSAEKLVLVNSDDENSYYVASKMDEVRFTDYTNYNGDLLIIKHSNIQNYNGRDLVIEYAAHKSSLGFNPVVIDIEEVINQFGYGINNHPQSLRNLFKFTQNNWDNLEYVFLIGKGRVYNEVREFNTYDNMIPTFGHPASDNLLFSPNGTLSQSVSIGRLSVSTPVEFKNYFDKMVEMETMNPASWEKKIIHISGGSNSNEQVLFRNVLSNLGATTTEIDYNVSSFSSENENNLYNEINSGSILMTYLGHGTPLSIETGGDSIELYNNKSKYPFFISMACKNGNYFSEGNQMSENFIFAENKGFVGYLGFTTDVSLFGANAISTEIYNQLDVINLSVGEIIKNSINNLQNSNGNIVLETAIHALVLHGDPTYKINKGTSFDISVDTTEQPIDNNTLLNDNIKEENTPSNSTIEPKISNYPNPVSDNTTFEVTLDESFVNISIQIFDIKGQLVKRLNSDFFTTTDDGKFISQRWNATDEIGRELSSGIYFYNVQGTDKFGNVKNFSPKSNIKIVK